MADLGRSKQSLEGINDKIVNVTTKPAELNNILHKCALDLKNVLGDNILSVDKEVVSHLNDVKTEITDVNIVGSQLNTEIKRLQDLLTTVALGGLSDKDPSRPGLNNQLTALLQVKSRMTHQAKRQEEYTDLHTCASKFDLTSKINGGNAIKYTLGGAAVNTAIDTSFGIAGGLPNLTNGAPAKRKYQLCDDTGKILPETGGVYTMQLPLLTGGTQAVKVSGISFTGTHINITGLSFNPPNVDTSQPLKLSINGVFDDVGTTGIDVTLNKKVEIDVLDLTLGVPCNTVGRRRNALNKYNQNNPGHTDVIVNEINEKHDNNISEIERDAFFRALRSSDGPKLDLLTPEQQEDLYQAVRRKYTTMSQYANPYKKIPGAPTVNPTTGLINMNNYPDFRAWFTSDTHPGSKDPYIKSETTYMNYIHVNLESQITEYFKQRFDEVFEKDLDMNRYLKTEVTDYLKELQRKRMDTGDVHQDVETDLKGLSKKTPVKRKGERFGRKLREDQMENPKSLLTPRDRNYMRFFANSSVSIQDQVVDINTNTNPDDLKNVQPVKYGMGMKISGKNNIILDVEIEGQGKARKKSGEQLKEHIRIGSGEPITLIRKILRSPEITHGKTRAHIAYNIIRGMIQMAQEKNISLTYVDSNNHTRIIKREPNGNIVLDRQDDRKNHKGNTRREPNVIFDYQDFINRKEYDDRSDTGGIRRGIEKLTGHFNLSMNRLHRNYRKATERKMMGIVRSGMKTRLSHSVWTSPLKKLLNCRTVTKFDFSTSCQVNGKTISISAQKNVYTISMPGLKKPLKGRDLGAMLNHREGKVRVFDGMERDMIEAVYTKIIAKMRENTKIARSNFGVSDPMTRRIYILDKDGNFGHISAEERDVNGNPISRGGLLKGKTYGVIHKINPARNIHYYNESETKEIMRNPFIIGKFAKAMNSRMNLFENVKSIFH